MFTISEKENRLKSKTNVHISMHILKYRLHILYQKLASIVRYSFS